MSHKDTFPPTEDDLSILFGTPLFHGLGEADLRGVAERIASEAYTAGFAANEIIVAAGEAFSAIGVLTAGEAAVIRSGEHRQVIHKSITTGDVFGVSSLFDAQQGFPTTIRATSECAVLFLTEDTVTLLLESQPAIAGNYIRLLTKKIRFLNHRLDSLAGRSAEERVADHLLSGIGTGGMLGVTKSALASMLGLGRASLYRILDLFEKNGFIRTARDRIEVLNADALKTFIKNRKE